MSAKTKNGVSSKGIRSSSSKVLNTLRATQPLPVHMSQTKSGPPVLGVEESAGAPPLLAVIRSEIISTARATKISVSGFGIKTDWFT